MTSATQPYELELVGSKSGGLSCAKPKQFDWLRDVFDTDPAWQPKRLDEPSYASEVRQVEPQRTFERLKSVVVDGRRYPMQGNVILDVTENHNREWIAQIRKKGIEGVQVILHGATREAAIEELYGKLDRDYRRLSSTIPVRLNDADQKQLDLLQQLIDVSQHQASKLTSVQGKAKVVDRNASGLTLSWYLEDEEFLIPSHLLGLGGWESCNADDWVQVAVTMRRGSGDVINAMLLDIVPEPVPMSGDELESLMKRAPIHPLPPSGDDTV